MLSELLSRAKSGQLMLAHTREVSTNLVEAAVRLQTQLQAIAHDTPAATVNSFSSLRYSIAHIALIFISDVWQACCSKEPKHLTLISGASP
jgi:hypothetical protein